MNLDRKSQPNKKSFQNNPFLFGLNLIIAKLNISESQVFILLRVQELKRSNAKFNCIK